MVYKIVKSSFNLNDNKVKEELENEVNKLISQGFIPIGNVSAIVANDNYKQMYQAMIKQ